MEHGPSLVIPSHFDGNNYAYWKVRMKAFLKSIRSEERRVGKECASFSILGFCTQKLSKDLVAHITVYVNLL